MIETEIKKLTAAITRLADLMEAGLEPAGREEVAVGSAVVDAPVAPIPATAPVVDITALRQQCQDACLTAVRADRGNKSIIVDWLGACNAKTIKQLGDEHMVEFAEFLEGLNK